MCASLRAIFPNSWTRSTTNFAMALRPAVFEVSVISARAFSSVGARKFLVETLKFSDARREATRTFSSDSVFAF